MNKGIELFGRLHPLLVHLPIGFLLMALVFQWLCRKEKYAGLRIALPVAYLLGMISAVLSCFSGWSLAAGGEYDEATLDLHRWMGISTAVISVIGYWIINKPNATIKNGLAIALFLLIVVTGHLGGTLTHGEGFITKGIFGSAKDSSLSARKMITNVQDAQAFTDIIQPVLLDKCGSCHSAKKQKGGLRLDGKEWIEKGGKEGKVLLAGNADASELYKRVVLDPLEEKHMPPKGKPQLTEQEKMLLHWWITHDGGFTKKVKELTQNDQIKPALLAMQSAAVTMKKPSIPEAAVNEASPSSLNALRNAGIVVLPVAANSNYLLANFVSIPKPTDQTVALLSKIREQLVWLKLSNTTLSADSWKLIAECTNLTRLSVEHTNLADASISSFTLLENLQYLNIVGTKVTAQGVAQLKNSQTLENIYLGQTAIKGNDFIALQKQFPKTILDSGNYFVQNLVTDTQLLKASSVKK